MSPEQLRNAKHVDGRADLWSLSVVAYYALMGSVPFRGDGLGEVIISIGMSDFTPPTETRPELPAALDAFFSQAFAPDMDDRFQNATALARAFRGASAIDEKAKPKSRKTATGTEFLLGKKTVPLTKAQIDAYLANHDATLAVVAPPPPPEEEPTSEPPSADVAEPIEIPMEASRHRRIGLALIGGIAAGGIALFGVRAMTTSERVETAASKLVPTVVATVPTASASAPPPAPPPKPTASAVVRPAASTKPPPVKPRPVKPRYPRDLLDSRD